MKQLSVVVMGCGNRGSRYIEAMMKLPGKFVVKAIAEPVKAKREYLRDLCNIPEDMCFESWEQLLELPKMADIAMVCTQDKEHFAPAMKAIEKKYDLLLEKPVSPDPSECFKISEAATKNGVKVLVCHVLRYTPFYKFIKNFIESGKLGEIVNIEHTEGVGNLHMSHSYVRGNWRRKDESSAMLLAKCCHDVDLMQWLLGKKCTKVQSFGSRTFFREENAPEGAPLRCTDGCPHAETCFYNASKFYNSGTSEANHFRRIVCNSFEKLSVEEFDELLKTSPYGRCVYYCDNDVVDHQIVNMQFGEDKHVTLTMSAFNKGGRVSTFMGTKGELRADMENQTLEFYDFATRKTSQVYEADKDFDQTIAGGHGGGDMGIMQDLYDYIANDKPSNSISDISVSCLSHLIAFAAEDSRLSNTVIDMDEYIKSV